MAIERTSLSPGALSYGWLDVESAVDELVMKGRQGGPSDRKRLSAH